MRALSLLRSSALYSSCLALAAMPFDGQDDTVRVSDPLKEGELFFYYHVLWKERVPPGLYQLAMVANDEVGRLVALRSVAKDSSGEPKHHSNTLGQSHQMTGWTSTYLPWSSFCLRFCAHR